MPSSTPYFTSLSVLRAGEKPKGMPRLAVQAIANEFLEGLHVSEEIEIRLGANLRDFFDPSGPGLEITGRVSGFFLPATANAAPGSQPARNIVALVYSNLSARRDVEQTLRHEILGH